MNIDCLLYTSCIPWILPIQARWIIFPMRRIILSNGDSDVYKRQTLGGRSSLGWDAIAVTNNCKNLDAALKFIDYCASQEGQDLLLWGIEGKDWTKDGDTYVPNEEVLDLSLIHI